MNNQNSILQQTKKHSGTNSLLEICKLFFAFVVLKVHGLTPIDKSTPWLTTAGISVEFFFIVMGWFLIKGINRHQEKYEQLGLWQSWWIFFKKKMSAYIVPCVIPGLITNILTLFYDGQIPNGMLWMYWFIHDGFVVMFIYYIIFYKVKNDSTRLKTLLIIFVISYAAKFLLSNYFESKVILYDFPRALSCISMGMLCSKLPVPKGGSLSKAFAWIVFIIVLGLEVSVVVFPAQTLFGVERIIFKDICNILLLPLLIWSCLWVNISLAPLNYIGKWSKGIYFWQMVPYTILVMGNFYNVSIMQNGYLLMCITFALTILEDPVRKLIKYITNKRAIDNPQYLINKNNRREKYRRFYWNKSTQISLFVIALACLVAAATMGIYGLIDGLASKNVSKWFMANGRNTFYCDGIVLLLGSFLIINLFPFNYYLTTRKKKHENK